MVGAGAHIPGLSTTIYHTPPTQEHSQLQITKGGAVSALKGLRCWGGAHSFTQRKCRMPEFQALVYSLWGEKRRTKTDKNPCPRGA